jgi:hypothetical protein
MKFMYIWTFIIYFLDVFALDPSFDVPVFDVTVVAGKTAILPCTVENLQAHKVHPKWKKPKLFPISDIKTHFRNFL